VHTAEPQHSDEHPQATKSGYVAILGKPNVGKSTLFNALVGERLSIVTPKPQTTRQRVLGIATDRACQMIFLDTPGILDPKYRLQKAMVRHVERSVSDADVLLAMLDATDFDGSFDGQVQHALARSRVSNVVVLNKTDRVSASEAARMEEKAGGTVLKTDAVVTVSALHGTNLDRLRAAIEERLPLGPFLYPPEMIADQPERFFVAELVREGIFTALQQEIPYSTAVKVEEFKDREKGKTYISAVIFVERESQKGIVIGAKGTMLRQIGREARPQIEAFLDRPVYLDLWVKVRSNWRKKDSDLRECGYLV